MNFSLKSPLFIAGTILFLLSSGVLGYHLLTRESTPDIVLEEPSKEDNNSEHPKEIAEIVVYLSGEINVPGVYKLKSDSRLHEAVDMAGGLTNKADTVAINLARILQDEDHVHIPGKGEVVTDPYNPSQNPSSGSNSGKININTASQKELESLPGIGPVLASKIIDYRKANGNFKVIEDVKKVSGIAEKRFEAIKDLITVR